MADEIHIAFCVDRGYFNQAAVTIASIVASASTPEALRFHIVHADDEAWACEQVASWRVPHVEAVKMENPFSGQVLEDTYISIAALLRIFLPTALPQLERVIYLDADLIITHDIREIWNTDLRDAAIGGVVDIGIYQSVGRGERRRDYRVRDQLRSLGIEPETLDYVNSGLLLVNLTRLRDIDFSRTAAEMFSATGKSLHFPDQHIINSLLRGSVRLLDPRWNVLAWTHRRNARRWHHFIPMALQPSLALQSSEQWMIHYTGPKKPWNSSEVWRGEVWWRYAAFTTIQWVRPAPMPAPTMMTKLHDAWLDTKSFGSQVLHRRRMRRAAAVRST